MSDFDAYPFTRRHCLSISDFHRVDIERLLELGAHYLDLDVQKSGNRQVLAGKTLINLFFENSTRTEKSFELAGKRLGADVISMQVGTSSVKKGETLLDTAATLNAMNPDLLVVRHGSSGAPALLSQKVSCSVINAGDGMHEHPTQALLDALTLRQAYTSNHQGGDIGGLQVAICGDILHSRVARSNVQLLNLLGANVRLIGPPTLIPTDADRWGAEVFHDMTDMIGRGYELAGQMNASEVALIGGAQLYARLLPFCSKLYVSDVDAVIDGDAHFPVISPYDWELIAEDNVPKSEKDDYDFTIKEYLRKT